MAYALTNEPNQHSESARELMPRRPLLNVAIEQAHNHALHFQAVRDWLLPSRLNFITLPRHAIAAAALRTHR